MRQIPFELRKAKPEKQKTGQGTRNTHRDRRASWSHALLALRVGVAAGCVRHRSASSGFDPQIARWEGGARFAEDTSWSRGLCRNRPIKSVAEKLGASTMTSAAIRLVIDSAVAELGHDPSHCVETILIRGGYFLGRQYRFNGIRAVWLSDDEVVKVYGDDGQLLRTMMNVVKPAALERAA